YRLGVAVDIDPRPPSITAAGSDDHLPLNARVITSTSDSYTGPIPPPTTGVKRDRELVAELSARDAERSRELADLHRRLEQLEALLARDEDVLRKLLGLIADKGVATRDEIRERMK